MKYWQRTLGGTTMVPSMLTCPRRFGIRHASSLTAFSSGLCCRQTQPTEPVSTPDRQDWRQHLNSLSHHTMLPPVERVAGKQHAWDKAAIGRKHNSSQPLNRTHSQGHIPGCYCITGSNRLQLNENKIDFLWCATSRLHYRRRKFAPSYSHHQ